MVNPSGRLQLFHHFHHDVDDGSSDRTDEVWALQSGSSMAHTVAIRPGHLLNRQMGFHMDWTRMLTWNSTDEILDDVQRQLDLHAAKEEKPGQPPPAAGRSVRALASSTTTKRKPTASKGRQRQVEPLGDDALDDTDENDDVVLVGSTIAPMVPFRPSSRQPYWLITNRIRWRCVSCRLTKSANEPPQTKIERRVWPKWPRTSRISCSARQ
jgi:hypothetical protein